MILKKRSLVISIFASILVMPLAGYSETNLSVDTSRTYLGAGLGLTFLDHADEEFGYQFFGGYELPYTFNQKVKTAIELGYANLGDFSNKDIDGLNLSGVASMPVSPEVEFMLKGGVDFGDDDGLLIGGGLNLNLSHDLTLRGEYIFRDSTDALQVNLIKKF